jgi:hypothetical protein
MAGPLISHVFRKALKDNHLRGIVGLAQDSLPQFQDVFQNATGDLPPQKHAAPEPTALILSRRSDVHGEEGSDCGSEDCSAGRSRGFEA